MTDYVEELEKEISRLAAAESQNFSNLFNLAEALKKSDKLKVDISRAHGLSIIAGDDKFIAEVLPGDRGFSLKVSGGTGAFVEFPALWNALRQALGESLYKQAVHKQGLENLAKFLGTHQ